MSNEVQTYGLNNISLKELSSIEADIRNEYEKVELTARDAFVKMGGLLDEARKLIDDDVLFGEWRKSRTPFESKENANKAMLLHRAIDDGIITQKMLDSKMGQSHLLELKDAPLSVQNDVEKLLESGNIPSIKNLREMKKMAAPKKDESEPTSASPKKDDVSTSTQAAAETPNYGNGYKDDDSGGAVKRSYSEQFGDILSHIEQIIDEDIMPLTADAHELANKKLNDNQRSTKVNELRAALKAVKGGLVDMIEFNEGRS